VPSRLHKSDTSAKLAFKERRLPLAVAAKEIEGCGADLLEKHDCRLICDNFLQALAALENQVMATVLPDYLRASVSAKSFLRVQIPAIGSGTFSFRLAWNPRLMRLNPHAARIRDFLTKALAERMATPGAMRISMGRS
jgi:DNA-binding transcriptional LysR family regulator